MNGYFHPLILLLILGTACSSQRNLSESERPNPEYENSFLEISRNIEPDSVFVDELNAYRDSLNKVMGEPIASLKSDLTFGKPENSLGNLMADILRFRAVRELRTFVHIGIINEDSFRLFLKQGEVSLGDMYELMPYDNHIVVLELSGSDVIRLMEKVAKLGGAPVSGVRMNIYNGSARGILINSEVVDPEQNYLVATSNYLADKGGPFNSLKNYKKRMDLNILVRDAYIDYFKNQRELEPVFDARIR